MQARIVITGIGVVSAAGVGREALWEALATGRSGIVGGSEAQPYPTAPVGEFGAKQHIEAKALRRTARMAQMGLVAAKQALAAAQPTATPERSGIVLGTGLGTLRETIDFMKGYVEGGPEAASPLLFPSSVMNAATGQMALELGWRGPNSTVNHREQSGLGAIGYAADLLALGRADAILAGGVEELNAPALHGYRRLGGLSATGMRPYSDGRDGTVLGEGAVVLLLEREEDAQKRGARVWGRITGYAMGGDVAARVGWSGDRVAAARVIRSAVDEGGAPDWIAGSGNGTGLDALESEAIARALGERRAPTSSILGQSGEFMASSALRVAAALYAIDRQSLPGTVGAGALAPDCAVAELVRESRAARVDRVLVPSLSQGGAVAAMVLARA